MTYQPSWITIGVVIGAHGVHGTARVKPLTDFPERFEATERVSMQVDGVRTSFDVEWARPHGKGIYLVKLDGIGDRDAAEALRGVELQVARDQVVPLPEGSYYVFELVGLSVRTVEGLLLGSVVDVLPTGANDVYVVRGDRGKDVLIPAIKSVVRTVDLDRREMVVDPPDGLLDL